MEKIKFYEYLKNNIMLLDGATGTFLQQSGMPNGVCPEKWAIDNKEVLIDVQKQYIMSGSNAVYTFTLGANFAKLSEFGMGEKAFEVNKALAELSRKAAGDNAFVVGDIGPTGGFVKPFGDMPFEDAVNIYKEQVKGLLAGGVDFFVIETMIDIQETRAALLAVKESCDLPVCVSMTFDKDKRTLTGTDPVSALITLQSLGADAVGCNCSVGPEEMLEVIKLMKPYAKIPLIAKPNAGLPRLIDGKTVFSMDSEEFASYFNAFIESGVNLFGGCCGTSPEFIKKIAQNIKNIHPIAWQNTKSISAVSSCRKTVFIDKNEPLIIIGERINPTGKKKLQEELKEGRMTEVKRMALEQVQKGAKILDVNVGMPGIDEKEIMLKILEFLPSFTEAPLCIDSSSHEVLEAALRVYPGRALINSISYEKVKLEKILPIAAKYGAMFILLPVGDDGVPYEAEERIKLIEKIYNEAKVFGFKKEDIVVDALVMTVSAEQGAAKNTLEVIKWSKEEFGANTVVGLSNVSFGLPERKWINAAFFAMAVGNGLSMAIANPSDEVLMNIKLASDVLALKDKNSKNYINFFANSSSIQTSFSKSKEVNPPSLKEDKGVLDKIFNSVVTGDKENIINFLKAAIDETHTASYLVDNCLIPAINHVGELFNKKEYYLPQLIESAQTMKEAFNYLEPMMIEPKCKEKKQAGIVLATVKGDVHDIGKNIVGLMLKNYGFKVYDLGKDVDAALIIKKAKETNAKIIALSALMTTTMVEMKKVIELAKKEGLDCKFMIGGAVVNEKYSDEIGADGYSGDAYGAVKLAQKLVGNQT